MNKLFHYVQADTKETRQFYSFTFTFGHFFSIENRDNFASHSLMINNATIASPGIVRPGCSTSKVLLVATHHVGLHVNGYSVYILGFWAKKPSFIKKFCYKQLGHIPRGLR